MAPVVSVCGHAAQPGDARSGSASGERPVAARNRGGACYDAAGAGAAPKRSACVLACPSLGRRQRPRHCWRTLKGVSVQWWIAGLVRARVADQSPVGRPALQALGIATLQLQAIGRNVNQIARQFNAVAEHLAEGRTREYEQACGNCATSH